jgi:transposase
MLAAASAGPTVECIGTEGGTLRGVSIEPAAVSSRHGPNSRRENPTPTYYIGLDVRKLSISFCIKQADGTIVREVKLKADRQAFTAWAEQLPQPWAGAMEARLVSHWIYHHLQPFAADLQMGNPSRMRAIGCAKKKTDRIDAAMIADLLRCNLLPAVIVLPEPFARMRQILRCRRLLVECEVRMKNKIAGLLMEPGIEYDRARLHGKNDFRRLLKNNQEIPPSVIDLLEFSREQAETLHRMEQRLAQGLAGLPQLAERVNRLTRELLSLIRPTRDSCEGGSRLCHFD